VKKKKIKNPYFEEYHVGVNSHWFGKCWKCGWKINV